MSFVIHSVKFSEQALAMFESQIVKFGTIETGGVLLGHLTEGTVHVEKASDPGPKAVHENVYFRADANYIDMYIDMEVANSGGKNHYLGEWHTHPQISPEPSDLDFESLYDIAATSDEFSMLLILGAIKFSRSFFIRNSIALIKYKDDQRFYQLKVTV